MRVRSLYGVAVGVMGAEDNDWHSWSPPLRSEVIGSDFGLSQACEGSDVGLSDRTRPGTPVTEQLQDVVTQAHHSPLSFESINAVGRIR